MARARYSCIRCHRYLSPKVLIYRDGWYFHLSHPRCQKHKGEMVRVMVYPPLDQHPEESVRALYAMMYDRTPDAVERIVAEIVRRAELMETMLAKKCHYCGVEAGTTRDHIVAKSWGGRGIKNLVPACISCNKAKADGPPTCKCDRCVRAVARWLPKAISYLGVLGQESTNSLAYRRQEKRIRALSAAYQADIERVASQASPPRGSLVIEERKDA